MVVAGHILEGSIVYSRRIAVGDMNVRKVACIGCGVIGHSWAVLFSMNGYSVVLQDVSEEVLKKALKQIRRSLNFLEAKAFIEPGEANTSYERLDWTTSIAEAVSDADYVQESVYERYDVKREVFKEADAAAPSNAILASSTSTLSMTEIQKAAAKPDRCLVVHPYNPPHLAPLVELIPGRQTSPETVEATFKFMEELGKVPIVLRKEVTGGIGNRLAAALWREAIDLVDKGVATVEDVDKAVCAGPGLRWAVMGPHLTYHLAGGEGGIEYYMKHLGPAMTARWRTMENWTAIPPEAASKLVQGVEEMELVRTRTREEIVEWRDSKLIELLKVLYPSRHRRSRGT